MTKLILKVGESSREFPVEGVMLIGRDPDSDICLTGDAVSDQHARISFHESRTLIEDLNSLKGTRVNGRSIERCTLHDGDEVIVGDSHLVFEESGKAESTSAPDGSSVIGRDFGDYTIEASLGEAQQGEVFRALNRSTQERVALKVLKDELSADAGFAARYLEETPRLTQLNHPFLIRYLEFGKQEEKLYFTMELCQGEPLPRHIEKNGVLRHGRVIDVAMGVCQALGHIAERGFSHQDVRPMNMMIDEGGGVKLVGLGLASLLNREASGGEPDLLTGDPHYMAPEQSAGAAIDIRADLYALGASMITMLTGKPPFDGPVLSLLSKHRTEPRPEASTLDVTVPERLSVLIKKLMAVDPDDRPADPMKVARELAEIKQELEKGAVQESTPSGSSSRQVRQAEIATITQTIVEQHSSKAASAVEDPQKEAEQGRSRAGFAFAVLVLLAACVAMFWARGDRETESEAVSPARDVEAIIRVFSSPTAEKEKKEKALDKLSDFGSGAHLPLSKAIPVASVEALPWLALACERLRAKELAPPLIAKAGAMGTQADEIVYRVLGDLGNGASRDFALKQMNSPDAALRRLAWICLSRCIADEDMEWVLAKLGVESDIDRKGAGLALQTLLARPPLHETLNKKLAETLGAKSPEGKRAIETVTSCLERLEAAPSLEAVPCLIELLESNDAGLKAASRNALKAAFGLDHGLEASKWRDWLDKGAKEGDPFRAKAFGKAQEK